MRVKKSAKPVVRKKTRPEPTGVQVVYYGGIKDDLETKLRKTVGRRPNDCGTCINGRNRRDLFWRCKTPLEATRLAKRLYQSVNGRSPIGTLANPRPGAPRIRVRTEGDHWEDKMRAIVRSADRAEEKRKRK